MFLEATPRKYAETFKSLFMHLETAKASEKACARTVEDIRSDKQTKVKSHLPKKKFSWVTSDIHFARFYCIMVEVRNKCDAKLTSKI